VTQYLSGRLHLEPVEVTGATRHSRRNGGVEQQASS
jgi:hypothetical protein